MVPKMNNQKPVLKLLPVYALLVGFFCAFAAAGSMAPEESSLISRFEIKQADTGDELLISADQDLTHSAFVLSDPYRLVIDIPNAKLAVTEPEISDQYRYLSDLTTRTISDGKNELVRIELVLSKHAPYSIQRIQNGLSIQLGEIETAHMIETADAHSMTQSLPGKEDTEDILSEQTGVTAIGGVGSGKTTASEVYGLTKPTKYKGKPIFLDLKEADILDIFRLIAEVSGFNVVVDPDVQGRITIRMDNVPWDQALQVILKNQGLGKEIEGNVMRIARNEKIRDENVVKQQMLRAKRMAVPLETNILYLSYADLDQMKATTEIFLSERGLIMTDPRVNALIVRDIQYNLNQIMAMIKVLDVRTRQVSLDAQIVATSKTFSRNLGIAWGGKFVADAQHGNTTPYRFPNNYVVDFSQNEEGATAPNYDGDSGSGYAVNLPAGNQLLALSFGNIMDTLKLNLLLTASEAEGLSKTIANPQVATSNNESANISSGFDIPYQTSTDAQVQTTFVSASTALDVTPHITNDDWISMDVNVTRDAPGEDTTAGPQIIRNSASTQVLVKDGDTLVIGGLNESNFSNSSDRIPWLGKIPVLGWLFKNQRKRSSFSDLLFFITPRILEEGEQVVRSEAF